MESSMSDNNNIEIILRNDKRRCCIWRIKSYFLFLCLIVLCQSMITSGYLGSIVSSIESYYGFSTERIGIAFSSYDLVGVISIPFISFFLSKYNRAKIVALGALLFSIGNLIFILPYLINGYDHHQENNSNSSNQTSEQFCSQNLSIYLNENKYNFNQPNWTYYLIILSMIIMSIGASPFYTLGITYLTDHLNEDDQPIYTSILYGMVALGPAIGFVMGSLFVSKWINIDNKIDIDGITKNDPRWIGRWWGGFIISFPLCIILSMILFTFPSHLRENTNEIDYSQSNIQPSTSLSNVKEMFQNMKSLLANSTYLLIILINSIENILVVSFTTFMVKYIESVFHLSSSLSSILTGLIVVPSAICGTISGGYFIRRFHLNIFGCIKLILISCLISLISLISLIFLKCQSNFIYESDNQCSQMCHCSSHIYQPVCFQEQQMTFVSPCYAGCTAKNGTEYLNCDCLPNGADKVRIGLCENVCLLKISLFLSILFVVTYFETLMSTPQLIIVLRTVKHQYQSFSLGFQNCLTKVLAQIPTPILFGLILDKQCLYWSQSLNNLLGSCFIYNVQKLPLILFGTAIVIKSISFILILILYFVQSKKENISTDDDHQEQQSLLNHSH